MIESAKTKATVNNVLDLDDCLDPSGNCIDETQKYVFFSKIKQAITKIDKHEMSDDSVNFEQQKCFDE